MVARRAPRRGGRSWRLATFWSGSVPTVLTNVVANSKVLLLSFTNSDDEDLTLRRVRGLLQVQSDQVAASEIQVGALGGGIFSSAAITAGVASLPDPVMDVSDDIWSVYTHIGQTLQFISAVGIRPDFSTLYEVDSKAMRKMPDGYSFAFVVANDSAVGAFQVSLGVRLLFSFTGK